MRIHLLCMMLCLTTSLWASHVGFFADPHKQLGELLKKETFATKDLERMKKLTRDLIQEPAGKKDLEKLAGDLDTKIFYEESATAKALFESMRVVIKDLQEEKKPDIAAFEKSTAAILGPQVPAKKVEPLTLARMIGKLDEPIELTLELVQALNKLSNGDLKMLGFELIALNEAIRKKVTELTNVPTPENIIFRMELENLLTRFDKNRHEIMLAITKKFGAITMISSDWLMNVRGALQDLGHYDFQYIKEYREFLKNLQNDKARALSRSERAELKKLLQNMPEQLKELGIKVPTDSPERRLRKSFMLAEMSALYAEALKLDARYEIKNAALKEFVIDTITTTIGISAMTIIVGASLAGIALAGIYGGPILLAASVLLVTSVVGFGTKIGEVVSSDLSAAYEATGGVRTTLSEAKLRNIVDMFNRLAKGIPVGQEGDVQLVASYLNKATAAADENITTLKNLYNIPDYADKLVKDYLPKYKFGGDNTGIESLIGTNLMAKYQEPALNIIHMYVDVALKTARLKQLTQNIQMSLQKGSLLIAQLQ